MKIEILNEFENQLLNRKELECILRHPRAATPTRAEIRDKLVALLNCDKEALFVEKIASDFGISTTKIYARVYAIPSEGRKVEPSHIIKRNREKAAEE
ncbi:MAG: 30S ribosomal protein S24e [Promethearchaeota archaeon]